MGQVHDDKPSKNPAADSGLTTSIVSASTLSASQQEIVKEFIAFHEAYAAFKAGKVFFDPSVEMPQSIKDLDALARAAPANVPEEKRQLYSVLYLDQPMRGFRVIDYKVKDPTCKDAPPLIYICHEHGESSQPNFRIDDIVIATLLDQLHTQGIMDILLSEGADIWHGRYQDFAVVEGMFIYKRPHSSEIKLFRPVDGPGKDKPDYFELFHAAHSQLPPGQAPLFAFIDDVDAAESYAAAYDRLQRDLPSISDNDQKLRMIADSFQYQLKRLQTIKQNIMEPKILRGAHSYIPRAVVFGTMDVLWLARKVYEAQQKAYEADNSAFMPQDYVVLAPILNPSAEKP